MHNCFSKKYIFVYNEIKKIYLTLNQPLSLMSNSTYILDDTLLVSSGTRFLNYIIDLVSFFVFLFAIGIVLGILTNLLGMTALGLWVDSLGDLGWNLVAITVSNLLHCYGRIVWTICRQIYYGLSCCR